MTATTLDPLAALEQAAQRQKTEEAARKAITAARVKLVLGKDATSAFFATLALRLRAEADWSCQTAATDGRRLIYGPEFVVSLPADQLLGLVAHEVMHCALAHMARRGARDPRRYNIAADLSLNPILRDAGFTLPPGGLFPGAGQYRDLPSGLSAEEYYALLPRDDDSGGQGEDPGGCGAVRDAGDDADQQTQAADWQVAVAQAKAAAQQRGKLPASIARTVEQLLQPTVDWRDVLREFLSRALTARDDYSWSAPNRRYIAQGIYLPSLRSEALGEVVIAVDTSGSISADTLAAFAGELNGILECQPCRVSVVYCDAAVQRVQEWEPIDGPLTLDAVGGGGTSHRPVWEWLRTSGADPAAVVCLTDGETDFGDEPGVPVLWALTPGSSARPPFGSVLRIGGAR